MVDKRTYWLELYDDFNQRCLTNLWITGLQAEPCTGTAAGTTPQRHVSRGRQADEEPAPMPAASAATSQPAGCAELRIVGGGIHTMNDLQVVDQFARNLRASPFFDKTAPEQGVVITEPPAEMGKVATFTFAIVARLAKPVQTISAGAQP